MLSNPMPEVAFLQYADQNPEFEVDRPRAYRLQALRLIVFEIIQGYVLEFPRAEPPCKLAEQGFLVAACLVRAELWGVLFNPDPASLVYRLGGFFSRKLTLRKFRHEFRPNVLGFLTLRFASGFLTPLAISIFVPKAEDSPSAVQPISTSWH